MIALFAALHLEVRHFLRRIDVQDRQQVGGFPVTRGEFCGRPLLICRTGVGRRAGEAARVVLGQQMPQAVVAVGLAGALSPECRLGDLVFSDRVHLEQAEAAGPAAIADPVESDAGLLELARREAAAQGLHHRIGGSLTVGRVVAEPGQKAALWRTWGLDVVEMESHWVGQAARELDLPFLAVRAVLDSVEETAPDIPGVITPEGDLRARSALSYALSHPARIPLLLRTARAETKAVANLTRFLEAFVGASETSPAGKPA